MEFDLRIVSLLDLTGFGNLLGLIGVGGAGTHAKRGFFEESISIF